MSTARIIIIAIIIMLLMPRMESAKKLRFHWLNNGGRIVSTNYDWIRVTITSTEMKSSITCPMTSTYTYNAGLVHRFQNLWIPADGVVSISIEQVNAFRPNEGVSINHFMNTQNIGFYEALLPVSLFIEKVSIGLQFQGVGVSIDVGGYTRVADYYLLLQLTNEDITTASYPSECSFESSLNQFIFLAGLLLLALLY